MTYVGLTDDPKQRWEQHGKPTDWHQTGAFPSEAAARAWEKEQLRKPGCRGGPGGAGWRFGYWYTITNSTKE